VKKLKHLRKKISTFRAHYYHRPKQVQYTHKDLKEHMEEYEKVFENLLKSINTPKHQYYLEKEKELNKLGMKIRKNLGLMTHE